MQLPDQTENFTICNTQIRQDVAGRYCLNDLHHAAGGEKRHQPSDWLRLQRTQSLVTLLEAKTPVPGIPGTEQNQPLIIHQGGDGLQGTFVCKQLVYAYAMWVSPEFELRVIDTFDEVMTGKLKSLDREIQRLEWLNNRDELNHVCEKHQLLGQVADLEYEVRELKDKIHSTTVEAASQATQPAQAVDPREGTTWMINNLPVAQINGELYIGAAALCRETGMSFKVQQATKLYRQQGVRVKAQSRSGVRELMMLPLAGLEQKLQHHRLDSSVKDRLGESIKLLRSANGLTLH